MARAEDRKVGCLFFGFQQPWQAPVLGLDRDYTVAAWHARGSRTMLEQFARCFNRADLIINPTEAGVLIDRTLGTNDELLNDKLWRAAGYESPPSVPQMIEELSEFDYRFSGRASEVGA